MKARFRIGDVFDPDDRVSQFLTGLAMTVNDVTLVMRQMDRLDGTPAAHSRENTYHLYLTASYLREAVKYVDAAERDGDVTAFLKKLSPSGQANLATVISSCRPWRGSFAQTVLKPIRDVVFHYEGSWSFENMRDRLSAAADDVSWIEFGRGRYLDTRYEFADAVFEEFVHEAWGSSTEELTRVIEQVRDLTLALTYFTHEAMSLHLDAVGAGRVEIEKG